MICFLFPVLVLAQKKDTLINKSLLPTGIRIGADLYSLVRNPIDDSFNGWELSADIDLYRYFAVVEAGQWQRNFNTDTETYSNDGFYWRAGVDINFLKKDPEKNMFFLGARYASGVFSENLTLVLDDTWLTGKSSYSNIDTKASWGEITGGLKVRLWKYFWLGYTARYKFALSTKGITDLTPHDIPGYGITTTAKAWGFNYYLLFRIPFTGEIKAPKK